MKRLEYETDTLGTDARPTVFIEFAQVGTVEHDMALGGEIEPRQQREERRLTRTGRPDNGHRLPRPDPETHLGKNSQTTFRTANLFADVFRREDGAIR